MYKAERRQVLASLLQRQEIWCLRRGDSEASGIIVTYLAFARILGLIDICFQKGIKFDP